MRAAFEARDDLSPAGDDWEWRQPVPGSGDERTALAWLRFEGDRLLVQCIARAHAERLRDELAALPGALLTFREMVGVDDAVDADDTSAAQDDENPTGDA